jgi:hypothetical protein
MMKCPGAVDICFSNNCPHAHIHEVGAFCIMEDNNCGLGRFNCTPVNEVSAIEALKTIKERFSTPGCTVTKEWVVEQCNKGLQE